MRRTLVALVLSNLVLINLLTFPNAVKLGTTSPRVLNNLEKEGLSPAAMDEALEEAAAAAAAEKTAQHEEEMRRFKAAELAREAVQRAKEMDWKSTADKAKKEREIDEKYGKYWKHVILHPWFQWLMGVLDDIADIEWVGEPRMQTGAVFILLFMLYKARQPLYVMGLAAAFFLTVHPFLIGGTAAAFYVWAKVRKPRGYVPLEDEKEKVKGPGRPKPLVEDARDVKTLMTLPPEVDHIVLGSDIGGLYTAALLARVGHSVVVLESGDSLGNCTTELKGVECDWGLLNTGMVHVYDDLLRTATLDGAPEIKWSRIGTEADGYSYDVARIGTLGDVVYRAGKQALVDDQVVSAADERERVAKFVNGAEAVAREQSPFFIGRLFPAATAAWIQFMLGQQYMGTSARTVDQIMSAALPEYERLDMLRGLFRTENLQPNQVSFAAYVSAMNHAFEGMNYPQGGFRSVARSLVPTIQAAGGRLFRRAHVKQILLDNDAKPTRARGVVLDNGQKVLCTKSVISASGVVPTFAQFLPKVPLPLGLDTVEEARPRLYTVLLLKGTAEELDLPAQDYYQVPTAEGVGPGTPAGWFHIYFPSAKDPSGVATMAHPGRDHGTYSTCVIETEADDDVLEVCYRRADGTTSTRAPNPPPGSPAGMPPPPPGLKFYKLKAPSDAKIRRLQQTMTRRLVQLYPQLEGRLEEEQGCVTVGPFRVGLSHRPSRFIGPGIRSHIVPGIDNLFLAGGDLVLGTFVGSLLGGWLAAHAALGYGALDLLLFQRNLNNDLKNVPRPTYHGPGATSREAEEEEEELGAVPDDADDDEGEEAEDTNVG